MKSIVLLILLKAVTAFAAPPRRCPVCIRLGLTSQIVCGRNGGGFEGCKEFNQITCSQGHEVTEAIKFDGRKLHKVRKVKLK